MVDTIYDLTFDSFLETLFHNHPIAAACSCSTTKPASKCIPTMDVIPISRVVYSGGATTVFFTDGTKTTVRCSSHDNYDRQTAIAYALVKRLFGKIGRYDEKTKKFIANEIDGNGLGTKLDKIASAGFDQELEKKHANEKKAAASAEHQARQKAQKEAAWKRRVAKRAEELRLEREAEALLNKSSMLNESKPAPVAAANPTMKTDKAKTTSTYDWTKYSKPNKPFSQFTSEEKKAYWRAHNAKRRALGK